MGVQEERKWKATVVFFSVDALGHINPVLSIVKELRDRHIRAIILTTRPLSMANHLKSLGFELEHCEKLAAQGTDFEEDSDEKLESIMRPLMNMFRKGPKSAFIGTYSLLGVASKHLDDMIDTHDIVEAKLKSLKPDMIVFDHIIGIPCVTTVAPRWARIYSAFPSVLFSSYSDRYVAGLGIKPELVSDEDKALERRVKGSLRDKIREVWLEKGCPDWPSDIDLSPTSPYLNFYLGPKELGLELVPGLKPLPEDRWFRLEHTLTHNDSKETFEIPAKLASLPGKLIYFSLGTLVTSDVQLINNLLKMLSKSPNKFIISMGQMHKYIKLFPNMWGQKFIDQKKVLPVVDLFITHGGHNSVIEAFYFGVPGLLVLPIFADQFDSAQRIHDCGFGIRLNPFECSQEELLTSIDSLLSNEELRRCMHSVGARLRSIRYDRIAADKIEQQLLMT